MSTELTLLAWCLVLAVVQILLPFILRTQETGPDYNASPRDKRGFFQRRTNDLQLRAIEEVRILQNFWGRMFNYGDVEFHGTGVDDLRLPALRDPVAIQKAVQEALGARGDDAELPGALSMPAANGAPHIAA